MLVMTTMVLSTCTLIKISTVHKLKSPGYKMDAHNITGKQNDLKVDKT